MGRGHPTDETATIREQNSSLKTLKAPGLDWEELGWVDSHVQFLGGLCDSCRSCWTPLLCKICDIQGDIQGCGRGGSSTLPGVALRFFFHVCCHELQLSSQHTYSGHGMLLHLSIP